MDYRERYLEDVNAHKPAELITTEVLNNLNNGYEFEYVADDEKYFNKGDIKMKKKGKKALCIDVKDDQVIARTGNFSVEAGGWSKKYDCPVKGWIDSNYNYVAVISREAKTIWILSFKRLREIYNKTDLTGGRKVVSDFWDNIKYNYLISIDKAIELGAVLARIEYEYDDWFDAYMPVKYTSKTRLQAQQSV